MISEVTFAREFTAFWRTTTPNMDGFVRRLNGLYDRDFLPMDAATSASRRSFINEVAFEVLCQEFQAGTLGLPGEIGDFSIGAAVAEVRASAVKNDRDGDYATDLSQAERLDVLEQVSRLNLRLILGKDHSSITLKPIFLGCGIIDKCQGDILVGKSLFEVKAGERSFRAIDVRQVLTYLALNYARLRYKITNIGLVNPRVGVSVELPVDELCYQVSGLDVTALLGAIAYTISSGEISR